MSVLGIDQITYGAGRPARPAARFFQDWGLALKSRSRRRTRLRMPQWLPGGRRGVGQARPAACDGRGPDPARSGVGRRERRRPRPLCRSHRAASRASSTASSTARAASAAPTRTAWPCACRSAQARRRGRLRRDEHLERQAAHQPGRADLRARHADRSRPRRVLRERRAGDQRLLPRPLRLRRRPTATRTAAPSCAARRGRPPRPVPAADALRASAG